MNMIRESVSLYDDPPTEIDEFLGWIARRAEKHIPPGCRDSGRIEIESDYESSTVSITLRWERPETDADRAKEEADKLASQRHQEDYYARAISTARRLYPHLLDVGQSNLSGPQPGVAVSTGCSGFVPGHPRNLELCLRCGMRSEVH